MPNTVKNYLEKTGIQKILDLPNITEVAINEPKKIWFERGKGWEFEVNDNADYNSLELLTNSMTVYSRLPVALSATNPIASVVLPSGERGQIIIPPATTNGNISITLRKPSLTRFTLDDYINTGRLNAFSDIENDTELKPFQIEMLEAKANRDMSKFFKLAVDNLLNILIVGGTGSGKTTVMKALVDLYPTDKRMFTIEDVHELQLPKHPNHLHLFYKKDGVQPRFLIESCMRMKPDHVFLAELRGDETWSYLEMLNTGHNGSITTVHANSTKDAFSRISSLVKQSEVGKTLDYEFIFNTVKKSIDVICFFKYTKLTELYFNPQDKIELIKKGF